MCETKIICKISKFNFKIEKIGFGKKWKMIKKTITS